MKTILEKIANLINVKSIVTIVLTVIFAILAIDKVITADQFISIFTVVIAFYFGTQYQKNENTGNNDNKGNDNKTE